MPMLYSLGQHRALEASLHPTETLMAFLDDVFAVTPGPDRVGAIYGSIQENMWVHSSIRIDGGKTQVWNGAGVKPAICEVLTAQAADPEAKVWKGSEVPPNQQGLRILESPVRPPRVCCCSVGEEIAETRDPHSKDPSRARFTIGMVDPVALRQCQGKLLAQSG